MKDTKVLYNERLERLTKAITLGKPDRTPVIAFLDSFAAMYRNVKMSVFSKKLLKANKAMIETFNNFPGLDAGELSVTPPKLVAYTYLCDIKLAGKQLPEGSIWQIDERERLSTKDYDDIIKMGWNKFRKKYFKEKLNVSGFDMLKQIVPMIISNIRFKKAGIVPFSSSTCHLPIEILPTGRSMPKFMADLYRMPDKVKEAIDVMEADIIDNVKKEIKQTKTFSVFLAISRGASQFLKPELWNKFVWPYIVRAVNAIVEEGVFVNLHFDSCWDREIERFRELPKGKCVWATDSSTDIFKLKKALNGHMCIKGDVSPALLTLGNPDEVYNYSLKLVKEIGPEGFILAPGCTLPMNAKPENLKAMISAATGK